MSTESKLSFVIFKQKHGKSLSFSLSYFSLSLIVFSVVASIVALGTGIYYSFNANYRQSAYIALKQERNQQSDYIEELDEQFVQIKDQLTDLIEKEEQLELLLGKALVKKKGYGSRN